MLTLKVLVLLVLRMRLTIKVVRIIPIIQKPAQNQYNSIGPHSYSGDAYYKSVEDNTGNTKTCPKPVQIYWDPLVF